jgi:NAD(P)H-nitrite reductase large subunit
MKYVILGSSAAGINAIRELRRLDQNCEIVLISRDKAIYSRCILHKYLCGERDLRGIGFVEDDFIDVCKVNWIRGKACTGIKPAEKTVILEDGEAVTYDKLLIATGSHSFIPPIKNLKDAKNVVGFRNLEDIEVLKKAAQTCKHIVVMGTGLVGMDAAAGFLKMGIKVTLVDMAEWLLSKQLDQRAAQTYIDALAAEGVEQHYGVGVSEVILDQDQRITEVVLSDETHLHCDYLVLTAGVRANIEFLEGSGIETSRFGLVYDETGRTSDPDIYGAGDVSGMSPIWPVAVKEGMIAAGNMAGVPRKMTDFFASKSTMSFLGIQSMSLGDVNPTDGSCHVEIKDTKDCYKKIIHKDGKITGALLQGDLAYGGVLQQLIARKIDVSKVKKPIFDIDYSDFFRMNDNFEFYYDE